MKRDDRVDQPVDGQPLRPEVDPEERGQEQVGLPGLDGYARRDAAGVEVPPVAVDTVVGDHPATSQRPRLTFNTEDVIDQHERTVRQSDASRMPIDHIEHGTEDGPDPPAGELEAVVGGECPRHLGGSGRHPRGFGRRGFKRPGHDRRLGRDLGRRGGRARDTRGQIPGQIGVQLQRDRGHVGEPRLGPQERGMSMTRRHLRVGDAVTNGTSPADRAGVCDDKPALADTGGGPAGWPALVVSGGADGASTRAATTGGGRVELGWAGSGSWASPTTAAGCGAGTLSGSPTGIVTVGPAGRAGSACPAHADMPPYSSARSTETRSAIRLARHRMSSDNSSCRGAVTARVRCGRPARVADTIRVVELPGPTSTNTRTPSA